MTASAAVFLALIGLGVPALALAGKRKLDAGLRLPRVPLYLEGVITQSVLLALSFGVAAANGIALLVAPRPETAHMMLAGGMLLAALATMLVATRFGSDDTLDRIYMIVPVTFGERIFWIFVSAFAAFGEELTYRGVLFTLLDGQLHNWWLAALIGTIVFAAAHLAQGWMSAFVIAVFGLGFQFLALKTGSLLLPVIVHFLYDVATGLYLSGRRNVESL
ncbi:MAG: CPBP family intramembrane metalloprotease [Acidobacteria bacterium]|nr:CPBP family intramembrane metalloprotease [Acidobacteriota bacterium]